MLDAFKIVDSLFFGKEEVTGSILVEGSSLWLYAIRGGIDSTRGNYPILYWSRNLSIEPCGQRNLLLSHSLFPSGGSTPFVGQLFFTRIHKVARTLEKDIQGLLKYLLWRITNAYRKAVKALIQEIKTVARGFRQFENFRIAILCFLGKIGLHPHKIS